LINKVEVEVTTFEVEAAPAARFEVSARRVADHG